MKRKSSKSKSGTTSAARSTSKSERKETKDIVSLILRDHKPIKELILTLKNPKISFAKKKPAFAEFERTLSSHAKAEEKSLYTQLKNVDHLRAEGLEGDTEHAIADQLMKDVNESRGDNDVWMAKVKVLAELVDHHLKEEEKEVLKKVRKDFDSDRRNEIGEMYSRRLSEYREVKDEPNKHDGKRDIARPMYV